MCLTDFEKWHPRLVGDELLTLEKSLEQMKDFTLRQDEVPLRIKLIENPKWFTSEFFSGAVDLFTHDCIHILLGRGLLLKDEAFVIGYTMGSTKKISRLKRNLFMFCSKYLYPEGYRFGEDERLVFTFGVVAGNKCEVDLSEVGFKELLDYQVGEIRHLLGVREDLLQSCYSLEKKLYPASYESRRLG